MECPNRLRSVQRKCPECPECPKSSPAHSRDTLQTLCRHSRARGLKGQENPPGTLRTLRPERPDGRISSKTEGPGEKGAPRDHPEISSQKLADFECRFPMTPMEETEHHFCPPFLGEGCLGQCPAAPCSPGPFVLLLKGGRRDRNL